ncbi:MAG: hypothetical protein ABJG88_06415 [Litorimonas sp.]
MSCKLKSTTSALLIAALLSGCATINLNEVGRPAQASLSVEKDLNIVQRAAASLSAVFVDRGFVAKTSRKRLQSAASVLLNGMKDKQIIDTDTADVNYGSISKSTTVILEDAEYARSYIDRTVAAAEIYLEIVPTERDLRKELTSLEKALLASTEAQDVFTTALKEQSGQVTADNHMVIFGQSVSNLRNITDEFGSRVRVRDTEKLASRGFGTIG